MLKTGTLPKKSENLRLSSVALVTTSLKSRLRATTCTHSRCQKSVRSRFVCQGQDGHGSDSSDIQMMQVSHLSSVALVTTSLKLCLRATTCRINGTNADELQGFVHDEGAVVYPQGSRGGDP